MIQLSINLIVKAKITIDKGFKVQIYIIDNYDGKGSATKSVVNIACIY